MSEAGPGPDRPTRVRTERMNAFSDGVFAIAITLLVLELTVPEATSAHPGQELLDQWPIYLAYVVSFASIGSAWLGHTVITEYLERADSILLRLNLLLLFFVSVLPFPTRMLSNFIHNQDAERIAVTIYGINLVLMAALISVIWHYARSEGLIRSGVHDDEIGAITRKLEPSLLVYVVAIGVGIVAPRAAVALYLVIALYVMIPFRTIKQWFRRREQH